MEPTTIFQPLRERRGRQVFLFSSLVIIFFYFAFLFTSAALALGFPFLSSAIFFNSSTIVAQAFASYRFLDYFFLLLFPVAGGLLFANCDYWACQKKGAKNLGMTGLLLGMFTISCPACLLPLLGLAAATPFFFKFGILIKSILLILTVVSTYTLAYRQQKSSCNPAGER